MSVYKTTETELFYIQRGNKTAVPVLWAHGWGQSHDSFLQMVAPLDGIGHHTMIDLPGFGKSALPPQNWNTGEYADFMADFIKKEIGQPVIWVGHSFGCRVGLQMAIRHPELIKGLFAVGGHGLRPTRTLWKHITLKTKVYTFKLCKILLRMGLFNENTLKSKFGSPDYRNADPALRPVMVRVSQDDLTDLVPQITCPVKLVYGTNDRQTPPEIGERLQTLIKNADMVHLDGQDHYTVLGTGRHQVVKLLKNFIQTHT